MITALALIAFFTVVSHAIVRYEERRSFDRHVKQMQEMIQ